jgi:hypothetical protein
MGNMMKVPSVISYSLKTDKNERQWGSDLSRNAIAMVHTKLQLDVDHTSSELDLILQALVRVYSSSGNFCVEKTSEASP